MKEQKTYSAEEYRAKIKDLLEKCQDGHLLAIVYGFFNKLMEGNA